MLPSHTPPEYANREALWNSVEALDKAEGKQTEQNYNYDQWI